MFDIVATNKQTDGVSVLHMHINAAIHARVRETARREGRTIRNLVEHALLAFMKTRTEQSSFASCGGAVGGE